MSLKNKCTVPCQSIALQNGSTCRAQANGTECNFSHLRPCFYSTKCKKMDEVAHLEQYYHPLGYCKYGRFCLNKSDNHFTSFAHPCYIEDCFAPTIAYFNGWVCGHHYKRFTRRFHAHRASQQQQQRSSEK